MTLLVPHVAQAIARRRGTPTAPSVRTSSSATTPTGGTASSVAITLPSTVAAGDWVFLVLTILSGQTLSAVPSGLIALPDGGGWTHLGTSATATSWPPPLNGNGGGNAPCWLFTLATSGLRRPANSSDHGTTFTFNISGSTAAVVDCIVIQGAADIGVGPIEGAQFAAPSITVGNDGGLAPRIPPIYPGPDDLVVAFGVTQGIATGTALPLDGSVPTGFTIDQNVQVNPNPVGFAQNVGVWIAHGPSSKLQWLGLKPDNTTSGFKHASVPSYACGGVLSMTPAGRNPTDGIPASLQGAPLHVYAASLEAWVAPLTSPPSGMFAGAITPDRLAWALGTSDYKNFALPGAFANDICGFAYGTATAPTRQQTGGTWSNTVAGTWLAQTHKSGLVLVEINQNDANHDGDASGANAPKMRRGAWIAMDSLVGLLRAASMTGPTDSSIAYTGSWTSVSQNDVGNGAYKWSSTPGDKVTITVSQDSIDVILLALDDTNFGHTGASFSVKVDGTLWGHFNTNAPWYTGAGAGTVSNMTMKSGGAGGTFTYKQSPYNPMRLPIYGMGAGSHTIEITHTGSSGQYLPFNAYLIPAGSPPVVMLDKLEHYDFPTFNAGVLFTSAAQYDVYSSMCDTIAAQFADGKVIVFDPLENTTFATLGSGLSTGGAITSIPINASVAGVPSGTVFTLVDPNSRNAQSWTLSAALHVGDTSLSVTSQTPNFAYPAGAQCTMQTSDWDYASMVNSQDHGHPLDTGTGFVARKMIRTLQERFG